MSLIDPELQTAEAQSKDARRQLAATLVELQARLNPRALAKEAAQELKETGEQFARDSLEKLKDRPLTVAGAAVAMGAFLARKPLKKLLGGQEETPTPPTSLTATPRRRARKGSKS
jgi:hypothetical protein